MCGSIEYKLDRLRLIDCENVESERVPLTGDVACGHMSVCQFAVSSI